MENDQFKGLRLSEPILRALKKEGYSEPTPIQSAAIPEILSGSDLMGTAQTGTGKTAAFSLPMLQMLSERGQQAGGKHAKRQVYALILTPTRELALQIDQSFRSYGRYLGLRSAVILGGVPIRNQIKSLSRRPEIVVATPGRLLDLMNKGHVRLDHVETLVLDEADRMLDMGFIHDMKKIVKQTPNSRQTLLFSATLTESITDLASDLLRDPVFIKAAPASTPVGKVLQKVMFVKKTDKLKLLSEMLLDKSMGRTLVFTRTKYRADRIKASLAKVGITADSIHSNKTQHARQRALAAFERGRVQVLVGTDVVARGIDVDGISHVINFEMPEDAESYVHRIGRTARAGADGTAYSFCDVAELALLQSIEKLTRTKLDTHDDHSFHSESIGSLRERKPSAKRSGGGRGRSGSRGRRSYR